MATVAIEERLTSLWETPKTIRGWLGTVDHKELGVRYLVTAFAFLVIGGVEALLMRIQLARPDMTFLSPEAYDQIFTMHGMTMIFWYASPILSGFAVYLIPLMIGARDLAFPRLNAFTYWAFLFSGIFLYIGPVLGQAPHAGWFAYVPYTLTLYSPALGMDIYALSLILLTISTTGAAINFIITILRMRAPGMAISRMPLFESLELLLLGIHGKECLWKALRAASELDARLRPYDFGALIQRARSQYEKVEKERLNLARTVL